MPRFFCERVVGPDAADFVLTGDDVHHIRDVLRLKPGDSVTVCDGARTDLDCRVAGYAGDSVILQVTARTVNQTEPPYEATLYQGLAKGDKMDGIIQKAVELGVSQIVPMICRRSVAIPETRDLPKKTARWNRIAFEAAKQCGRGLVPPVSPPRPFADAVREAAAADIRLIPWELERLQNLRTALTGTNQAPPPGKKPRIAVLIGPEGGFAADEIELALASGIVPVTLGRRVLRTETAGPAVLAMILYQFADF